MEKILFLIITFSLSSYSFCLPNFPTNPLIGVIGGSFGNCQAPEQAIVQGVGLAGCSYESLYKKLIKNPILDDQGYRIESAAQGGAATYDIAERGYKGYKNQIDTLVTRTSWFDDTQRLKYVIFTITNDCLHNRGTMTGDPCTQKDIDESITRTVSAVQHALNEGITPIINSYPRYEDIDLELVKNVFGLEWVANEYEYKLLKNTHENILSNIPGVIFIKPWDNFFSTFDGLHPTDLSTQYAANTIAIEIWKNAFYNW